MSAGYIIIDELWNFLIFPYLAVFLAIGLAVFFVYYWKVIPPVAKTFTRAKRKNRVPCYVVHDSGYSTIELFTARTGSIALTEKKRFKILPRFSLKRDNNGGALGVHTPASPPLKLPPLPEGVNFEDLPEDIQKIYMSPQGIASGFPDVPVITSKEDLYDKFFLDYSTWTSRRSELLGLGLPMFVAYSGSACLLNPEALALWTCAEMSVEIQGKLSFNPLGVETNNTATSVPQPIIPLDPRAISTIISDQYDESAIAKVQLEAEQIALEGMGLRRYFPLFIIMAIAIIGVVLFIGISG